MCVYILCERLYLSDNELRLLGVSGLASFAEAGRWLEVEGSGVSEAGRWLEVEGSGASAIGAMIFTL
jgi:hypothetical protein